MTRLVSSPPPDPAAGGLPPARQRRLDWIWAMALMVGLFAIFVLPGGDGDDDEDLAYSELVERVDAGDVATLTLRSDGRVSGETTDDEAFTSFVPIGVVDAALLERFEKAGVEVRAEQVDDSSSLSTLAAALSWLLILAPFGLIAWFMLRSSRGGGVLSGALAAGRSKAKVFGAEQPRTSFADVAGYEGAKAEIAEVVDFLRQPDRYRRAGAVAPRGVLMMGPPGTGKTLFARAVAGEASVTFFSVTGSSFVEMFVGVGAARVRDLFAEARKQAPAIVFVDELDAIGQRRGGPGALVANDEREQTLNQLLSEMDGFDSTEGIVVLAATNRPEVLDPALLRPGRFDREVVIPLPTLAERAAILAVHCRDKRLGPDVDLDVVARGTPGFSGADLANLANEAAIVAVRGDREVLTASDFDEARDRIVLGRREGSNVLLPEEKHAVAVHEAGHALVAALSPHADPVAKLTILPAGQTLGATHQLPLIERHLLGEDYLLAALDVRLGGRAAELVELGQGSSGAANDLAEATELATKMVRELGLSEALGPVGYPQGGSVFLGGGGAPLSSRPFAEMTQGVIDAEVARLVREAERRAIDVLGGHRAELHRLVELLMAHETVDGAAVYDLLGVASPQRPAMPMPPLSLAPRLAGGAQPATG